MANEPKVQLWDASTIYRLEWPQSELGQLARSYLLPIIQSGLSKNVSNVHGELYVLQIGDLILPIIISNSNYSDTYVVSTYTHYISYPIVEMRRHMALPMAALAGIIPYVFGQAFRYGHINRTVSVNNWLLSTPLYPNISETELSAITKFLTNRFPDHAILFRSVNEKTTDLLMHALEKRSYRFMFSRQVYIMLDKIDVMRSRNERRHIRNDLEMLNQSDYEIVSLQPSATNDAVAIQKLYECLYIEKYSPFNPNYTVQFFQNCIENQSLRIYALRQGSRIDGVIGLFALEGILTAPFFGYDTKLPRSLGLYRMLSAATLDIAEREGLIDHASSGVADFKRMRGYRPVLEYNAVFTAHLSKVRQRIWRLLEWYCNRIAQPSYLNFETRLVGHSRNNSSPSF